MDVPSPPDAKPSKHRRSGRKQLRKTQEVTPTPVELELVVRERIIPVRPEPRYPFTASQIKRLKRSLKRIPQKHRLAELLWPVMFTTSASTLTAILVAERLSPNVQRAGLIATLISFVAFVISFAWDWNRDSTTIRSAQDALEELNEIEATFEGFDPEDGESG